MVERALHWLKRSDQLLHKCMQAQGKPLLESRSTQPTMLQPEVDTSMAEQEHFI